MPRRNNAIAHTKRPPSAPPAELAEELSAVGSDSSSTIPAASANPLSEASSPSARPRATAKSQGRAELARQVLELRLAGFTYEEVRHILGLKSDWQVWNLQQRALKQFAHERPSQLRQLDVARLDRLIRGLWRKAVQGDLPALDRVIKLLNQRERYVRRWAKPSQTTSLPRMTLLRALAADRQLEAWLEQHRPDTTPRESVP